MTSITGLFRKTLKRSGNIVRRVGKLSRNTAKRGVNVVRKVGKMSRKTLKRGTNTLGLTKRSRGRKSSRRSRKAGRR